MANHGNEKVIAGIDQFCLEVATQIFNVHITVSYTHLTLPTNREV